MRRFAALLVVLVLGLSLAACGDDSPALDESGADDGADTTTDESADATDTEEIAMEQGDAGVTVTGELGAKPVITVPGGEPPTTLLYSDLVEGDGAEAPEGAAVSMHYVGVSWSNGEQFDASWDNGKTLDYPLSQLIEGWQRGVPGMKVGGRRLLVIPPALGYGSQQVGSIAANETLVFVIDLVALP